MILHFMIKSMSKPRLLTGSDIFKKNRNNRKTEEREYFGKEKGVI